MTENLANIDETMRAIDDIGLDIQKLQRMANQLADYKALDETKESQEMQMAFLYAKRIQQAITDQIQMRELLRKHLSNMKQPKKVVEENSRR